MDICADRVNELTLLYEMVSNNPVISSGWDTVCTMGCDVTEASNISTGCKSSIRNWSSCERNTKGGCHKSSNKNPSFKKQARSDSRSWTLEVGKIMLIILRWAMSFTTLHYSIWYCVWIRQIWQKFCKYSRLWVYRVLSFELRRHFGRKRCLHLQGKVLTLTMVAACSSEI